DSGVTARIGRRILNTWVQCGPREVFCFTLLPWKALFRSSGRGRNRASAGRIVCGAATPQTPTQGGAGAWVSIVQKRWMPGFSEEDCRGDDCCPAAFHDLFRRLAGMGRADDPAAALVDLFPLLPCPVRIELDAERGGEHGCREVFGVLARDLCRLSESMVLGEVAVGVA